jgi:hypothetical protein
MDRRAGEAHTEALKTGDAYVIVWPDAANFPRIYPQRAGLCTVEYDTETPGVILKAGKVWRDNANRWRMTLYYPDRLEKYASIPSKVADFPSGPGMFEIFEVPGEPWPLPNPYGQVPVFHFPNNAFTGEFGLSELKQAIPIQDAFNKSIADMLIAMEFVAFPQRWVTGIEVDIDETTGKPRQPFIPGADRVWTVGAPDANFGQFPGADLTQYVSVKESFREDMAIATRTPLHYFKAARTEFPSGEAMKTAEQPLMSKVKDRQIAFGNIWEDVMGFALRVAGRQAGSLSCTWLDTSPRNEQSQVETLLLKKEIGVSKAQLMREAGYTEEQIEQFAEEREVETAGLGESLLAAFDRNAPVTGQAQASGRKEEGNNE